MILLNLAETKVYDLNSQSITGGFLNPLISYAKSEDVHNLLLSIETFLSLKEPATVGEGKHNLNKVILKYFKSD